MNVVEAPDLTVRLTVIPSTIKNKTCEIEVLAKIQELNGSATHGVITVLIPKDPRFTFVFDTNLSTIGAFNKSINNIDWVYNSGNFLFHEFKSSKPIVGSSSSTFGFLACYDPGQSKGTASITAQISEGSGGELRFSNNNDVEILDFIFKN